MFKNRYTAMKSMIAAGALSLAAGLGHAAGVDYTALTGAADFGGLGTALVGIIVALIGASLLVAGGMAIWSIVKKGRSV